METNTYTFEFNLNFIWKEGKNKTNREMISLEMNLSLDFLHFTPSGT